MPTLSETRTITVAHSPDSDDAFMFYGLATNKLDTGDLDFTHVLKDIQTLNEEALRGTYDVTAISFHAYAYIADKYALLPHGASIGDNYGPILVSRRANSTLRTYPNLKIAVPGNSDQRVSRAADLQLRISITKSCPSTRSSTPSREAAATPGLLIHEGQLFYESTRSAQGSGSGRVVARNERACRCRWAAM